MTKQTAATTHVGLYSRDMDSAIILIQVNIG